MIMKRLLSLLGRNLHWVALLLALVAFGASIAFWRISTNNAIVIDKAHRVKVIVR